MLETRHSSLVTLLALAIGLAACGGRPYTFHGTWLEPALPAANFALTNQDGQTIRLSDFRGQLVLLFFGYTHCPDACPTTLAQFKQIRNALGANAARTRFVLVTVDPARDTPERLKEYLAQFDSSFVGLTGSADALAPVYRAYGVSVEAILADELAPASALRTDSALAGDSHSHTTPTGTVAAVAHTSSVFLLDDKGQVRLIYTDIPWQDVAADIRYLLK
jgi:protein SCO1/2